MYVYIAAALIVAEATPARTDCMCTFVFAYGVNNERALWLPVAVPDRAESASASVYVGATYYISLSQYTATCKCI